jgi:hypothetical protein
MCDQKLVYVEHFCPFSNTNLSPHCLFSTKHAMAGGTRKTSVIPLSSIRMACHLTPHYKQLSAAFPVSSDTDPLSSFNQFYFNNYCSHFVFAVLEHWRKRGANCASESS